ncbi:MAG: DUF5916 domain-containing protein [Bacteroidales bacterium]
MIRRNVFLLLVLFLLPLCLSAQKSEVSTDERVVIDRLAGKITFDGIPDESTWKALKPFSLVMFSPYFGKEPGEKSDIRMGYDDEYLYVGANFYYKDASEIRSASFKRDFMGMGGDWLGIILDSYNDKENGLAFFTSPDALRWDATILKDAVTSMPDEMPFNISWNTFWDVMTHSDSSGWTAEVRIPLSGIRFQEKNGEVVMGLILQRWIPARGEWDVWPAIPPQWGQMSTWKPSQAHEVVFRGLKGDKPLYIAPYMLGGWSRNYELNETETAWKGADKPVVEAGLDVKFGLADNLVADVTLNTDFAQVEADDQQFNLTRFSLYFPEKRMFFLERSSIFDFALGGTNNLFYSRRIGLSDDGDPVRIYGGARLTGRAGKWDLGFLDMQTAPLWEKQSDGSHNQILPSENFGVLRLRKQVINENSYIGTMLTSRLGVDGSYNMAYGLDGIFKLFGEDYMDIKWSQTFEDSVKINSFLKPSRILLRWERRSQTGLGYNLGYSYSGTAFNPGIGFEMINDYVALRGELRYGWLPGEDSKVYRHTPDLMFAWMRYVDTGELMTFSNTLTWTTTSKIQSELAFSVQYNLENLRDSLVISENNTDVPPGKYEYVDARLMYNTPMSEPLWSIFIIQTGKFFDGSRFSFRAQPTWNLNKHYELGLTYNFDRVVFNGRHQEMNNHIFGFKGAYMLNTKLSINGFIQYNTDIREVYSNLRLRYNPKEGNDFYLVYNEGRNTELTRETPRLPHFTGRSLMVKYTYTFSL